MTYAKIWDADSQEDLKLLSEEVRRLVKRTSVLAASHPHMGASRMDPVTGHRVVRVEGTHMELHYEPDIAAKVITIRAVEPVDGAPGDPYLGLA